MERAIEETGSGHRLVRVTAEIGRPIPMAGFRIAASVTKSGRMVTNLRVDLTDKDGRSCVVAAGMAMRGNLDVPFPTAPADSPAFADSEPGSFPLNVNGRKPSGFAGSVEVRYPSEETVSSDGAVVWMKTVPLLDTEDMSPFQRICPLADCGNAFSRHGDPTDMGFVNADLTVNLHRDPSGEWMGSKSVSHWQPTGVGMSQALLFDDRGPVGVALQSLLLVPFD